MAELAGAAMDAQAMATRLQGIPFMRAIGMGARGLDSGAALTTLGEAAALAPGPGEAGFCEGMVAAALDQAGSAAIWAGHGLQLPHATVTLSMMFLAPGEGDELVFDGRLIAIHGGLGHTLVTVRRPDGVIVAEGLVNYAIGSYPGDSGPSGVLPPADPAQVNGKPVAALEGDCAEAALGLLAERGGAHRLPFRTNLLGSRDPLALHGGVIAAASVACAKAQRPEGSAFRLSHLTVDYLRAGLPQATEFRPHVLSKTRKTLLVEVDAFQEDGRRHIASASARFYAG